MRSKRERSGSPSALSKTARPVMVDLAALWPHHADTVRDRGLDLTADVSGGLWEWTQATTGLWLGVVTFRIERLDDRNNPHYAQRQLVPAHALRPR